MILELTLNNDKYVCKRFCNYLISNMRKEIVKRSNRYSIEIRLNRFQKSKLVQWSGSAHSISYNQFMKVAQKAITFTYHANTYMIYIDPNLKCPNTLNSIDQVIRFVDKGDLDLPGCYRFTKLFSKYARCYKAYFAAFRLLLYR